MFSFFKKILGASESDQPVSEKSEKADSSVDSAPSEAELRGDLESLPGAGEANSRFLEEIRSLSREQIKVVTESQRFRDLQNLSDTDAYLLCGLIYQRECSRLMVYGAGASILAFRHALNLKNLPAELIVIDPDPSFDLEEYTDAELDTPFLEVPVGDFEIMQANEVVFIDLSARMLTNQEIQYLFDECVPKMPKGLLLGFNGITRNFSIMSKEQKSLLGFLLKYLNSDSGSQFVYGFPQEEDSQILLICI